MSRDNHNDLFFLEDFLPLPLGLQEVISVFLKHYDLPERSRVALRGRLQHLQKQGFPPGVNTGRGKPARYRFGELLLIGMALEFSQFGVTPERAVAALEGATPEVLRALRSAEEVHRRGISDFSFLVFFPEELNRSLGEGGSRRGPLIATTSGGFLFHDMEHGRRFAAVSASRLFSELVAILLASGLATDQEILEDIQQWLSERGAAE